MSKAQEFADLVASVRETKPGMTGKVAAALHETTAWVAVNADLIARALRRDEAIENPTHEIAVPIGQAVEYPCKHPGWDDRGFAAIDALREAVK